jgi:hypothetical protein
MKTVDIPLPPGPLQPEDLFQVVNNGTWWVFLEAVGTDRPGAQQWCRSAAIRMTGWDIIDVPRAWWILWRYRRSKK